ncbi:MAG: DUF5658 family protein [Vicinamibacterales bacterium]|nr:DUF5658 family protein [Vicinamibacterales bacterium]
MVRISIARLSIALVLSAFVTTTVAADTLGTTPSSRPFDSVSFGAAASLTATDAGVPVAPVAVTMTTPLAEALAARVDTAQPVFVRDGGVNGRPKVLPVLYASLAALQVMDALSTFRGLELGAIEANPVMAGIADNRKAMFAVKAGVTAASILVAERLWKRNRVAAVVTMVGLNALIGTVVAHNHSVLRQLQ